MNIRQNQEEFMKQLRAEGLTPRQEARLRRERAEAAKIYLELLKENDMLDEALAQFPVEKRLAGMTPEERLAGMTPEEILSSLNPEEVRKWLEAQTKKENQDNNGKPE